MCRYLGMKKAALAGRLRLVEQNRRYLTLFCLKWARCHLPRCVGRVSDRSSCHLRAISSPAAKTKSRTDKISGTAPLNVRSNRAFPLSVCAKLNNKKAEHLASTNTSAGGSSPTSIAPSLVGPIKDLFHCSSLCRVNVQHMSEL